MSHTAADLFKVLGVETRVRIIELLKEQGPQGVNALAETLSITPAAVSQHLKVLRHAGLVVSERQGYWKPYAVDQQALDHCRDMLSHVCACDCHGIQKCRHDGPQEHKLTDLKKYQARLKSELAQVQQKIAKLESK